MNKILLRIADLRKKAKVTQQELADSIGVSFQTISKWETGVSLPDITILPLLADYFQPKFPVELYLGMAEDVRNLINIGLLTNFPLYKFIFTRYNYI